LPSINQSADEFLREKVKALQEPYTLDLTAGLPDEKGLKRSEAPHKNKRSKILHLDIS